MTLEKLLADGRIHPARIEETYYQAQVRARGAHRRGGRAGRVRGQRPGPGPRADQAARPAALPHQLRPERARPLRRVRAPGGDDGRTSSAPARRPRAARRCCTTSARPSRTRSRARTRSSAATSPAATASPRRSPTRWRPTTTRSSRRPSRPSSCRPPTRCRARAPGPAASRWSTTSSACATSSRSPPATTGVDKVYAMQAGREIRVMVDPDGDRRRRRRCLALARDRPRDRAGARVPRPDQGHVIRESRAVDYAK